MLKNGDFVRFIGPAISSIAMLMLVELLINYNLFFTTLKKINMYFRICYIVNFFTIIAKIIFKSSGIHYICFLGIDNRFIFPFFAWMLSEALVDIHNNNKITKTSKIIFFLIEISLLLVQTTAAMVIFTIWIVPLFIKNKHLKKLLINKINVVFNSIFLLDILIVRYRLSYMFSNILNYFGKFPHISGRVLIWNNIFDFIVPNNFWLGIGMQSELYDMTYFGNKIGEVYSVNHAHNTYIDIIYRYGFIGVLIFITIICYLISTLKKEKQNKFILPILISFSIILLLGIFDTMIYPGLFFLIGIVYNIDKLNEQ
ncbi:MAG: O-antigen ligase family protein [Bacilli bacterium]|nr:O-antigen ligase family protein [Bacilli bacterium]